MQLPDWRPDDAIDRLTGGLLAAKLETRLQQWPNAKPEAKQCQYARGTGDVARTELFKRGVETYTLLPTVTYLDQLALAFADEQQPFLPQYQTMVGEVAKHLYDASDPARAATGPVPRSAEALEAAFSVPAWEPAPEAREATAALSRLIAQRLTGWPYALGLDDQTAYARALAREAVALVAAEDDPVAAEAFTPVTDYLRHLARTCAESGFDERLGSFRRAAALLSARLLIVAGPGEHQ